MEICQEAIAYVYQSYMGALVAGFPAGNGSASEHASRAHVESIDKCSAEDLKTCS